MAYILTNDELNDFLGESWDNLCHFAYEQFLNHGRGFIGIDCTPDDDDFQLIYVAVTQGAASDDTTKSMVAKYNPKTEIILYFACAQGQYRTVRLKSEGGRGPESVWTEAMTLRKQEQND